MQDQSTTGINEGISGKIADKNLKGIGPFTELEIESVARKCVTDLGMNWDKLTDRARSTYIGIARDTLLNDPVEEHLEGRAPDPSGGMKKFQESLLIEFRNSPKWDEDLFVSGLKPGPVKLEGGNDTTGG
jgi:hypothetical protein